MKMIVGLGNPGKDYEKTRHNMGFMAIDNYVKVNNLGEFKNKFNGMFIDTIIDDERVIFLKPTTYMNLSGEAVLKYINYFKIDFDDILIISDDLDISFGKFKLKSNGSSGGHNGLKNIESNLSTSNYKRLKLGIGNDKSINTKNYVLSRFSLEELEIINKELSIVNDIIDDYLKMNFDKLMNKYNIKNKEV